MQSISNEINDESSSKTVGHYAAKYIKLDCVINLGQIYSTLIKHSGPNSISVLQTFTDLFLFRAGQEGEGGYCEKGGSFICPT